MTHINNKQTNQLLIQSLSFSQIPGLPDPKLEFHTLAPSWYGGRYMAICKMNLKFGPQCLESLGIFWKHKQQYNCPLCFTSDSSQCTELFVTCLMLIYLLHQNNYMILKVRPLSDILLYPSWYVALRWNKSRNSIKGKVGGVRKNEDIKNKG